MKKKPKPPVRDWHGYVIASKMFFLKRADMRAPVELAVAPLLLFVTAREVKKHADCPESVQATMAQCITLLAPDVAAPVLDLQQRVSGQRDGAATFRTAKAVIDGLAFYLWGLERIAGGKPYEAMLAEAVALLNHLIDCGYVVPDEDSPAMAAAALLTEHINDVAAADATDRTAKLVKAALQRVPQYLAKLQKLGLFLPLQKKEIAA